MEASLFNRLLGTNFTFKLVYSNLESKFLYTMLGEREKKIKNRVVITTIRMAITARRGGDLTHFSRCTCRHPGTY